MEVLTLHCVSSDTIPGRRKNALLPPGEGEGEGLGSPHGFHCYRFRQGAGQGLEDESFARQA